jgi:hypothetical protein
MMTTIYDFDEETPEEKEALDKAAEDAARK